MPSNPSFELIVKRLQNISGVEAVVVDGPRARNTQEPPVEFELGVYYSAKHPLDFGTLKQAASELDEEHRANPVTPIGAWGPWNNGGGQINSGGTPVGLIYRELEKVERVIEACRNGKVELSPGTSDTFNSSIYLTEVAVCQPVWDPNGTLAKLKEKTHPYPPALKQALLDNFWWEVDFSLKLGLKSIAFRDAVYGTQSIYRCVSCLIQSLFAANEQYWVNEKGAVTQADTFTLAPEHLRERLSDVFGKLDGSSEGIQAALEILSALVKESNEIIEKTGYKPAE